MVLSNSGYSGTRALWCNRIWTKHDFMRLANGRKLVLTKFDMVREQSIEKVLLPRTTNLLKINPIWRAQLQYLENKGQPFLRAFLSQPNQHVKIRCIKALMVVLLTQKLNMFERPLFIIQASPQILKGNQMRRKQTLKVVIRGVLWYPCLVWNALW